MLVAAAPALAAAIAVLIGVRRWYVGTGSIV